MKTNIIKDVDSEIESARNRFPAFHSHHEAYAVILEEVDELWDCVRSNDLNSNKYGEAIQIIAMVHCYIEEVIQK